MEGVALAQLRDDGLSANQCYPKMLIDDPTFAILNGDSYFARHGRTFEARFGSAIPGDLIVGKSPPFRKRDEFVFDIGNSSRRPTPEELEEYVADAIALEEHVRMLDEQMEQLAYVDCVGDSCATQLTPVIRYIPS